MPQAATQLRFASAISSLDMTDAAMDEVLGSAAEQLGDGAVDLAIVWATYHHQEQFDVIAERIAETLGPRACIGGMMGGVLAAGRELEHTPGIALLAARLPGVSLNTFTYADLDWPASGEDPGHLAGAMFDDMEKPAAVIVAADPFTVPMSKLLPTMNAAAGDAPIVGGMLSGAQQPGENRMIIDGRVLHEGLVGVSIGGSVAVDVMVTQGCRPIGSSWVITEARKNLIMQLGGQPVMDVIRKTAGECSTDDREMLEQGLLIGRVIDEYKSRFGRGDFLIRNVMGVGPEEQYIAVSDFVRKGQTIQFHVRDAHTAEEDLRLMLTAQKLQGRPAGALLFTCNGRGSGMYGQPDRESEILAEELGEFPVAGFFAAGEIGPIGSECFLHGFTGVLVTFRGAEG